jgi:hypothetical protein
MTKRTHCNLRVERWKRAVDLAKILFDDQGYHSVYLDDLLSFALDAADGREIGDGPDAPRPKTQRRSRRCS